ncbi:hypothetical protein AB0M39_18280 [Streptomyces sp. NPDC051907]|uniref:hypothetical protein n=1 Tax=Streptomyces sp. NPDC051907 TaxID=3155284 RepID=UPI0034335008
MRSATATGPGGRIDSLLDTPIVGMLPWILFSVLAGPGRFELAVGLALAAAVLILVATRVVNRGSSVKILEVADVVFFAVMAVIGAFASAGTYEWLETYANEVSNIALVLIAFGSMAVGVPFTIQYARERVDREHWGSPHFLRANYVITGVWACAFLVAALAGAYGDAVLHNPDNVWTNWIIQVAAIVVAARFTEWYPRVVASRASSGKPGPPVRSMLIPLVGLLIPIGVVVLIFDAAASWFGVALIITGVLLARAIGKDTEMTHDARRHRRGRLK